VVSGHEVVTGGFETRPSMGALRSGGHGNGQGRSTKNLPRT